MRVAMSLWLLLAGCATGSPRGTDSASDSAHVAKLRWLHGDWLATAADGTASREEWRYHEAGVLVGSARTDKDGATVFREHMQIDASHGRVLYRVWPEGQAPAEFPLVSLDGSRAVFENPAHDFPKRIEYVRRGDQLSARIDGEEAGQPRSAEWAWKHASVESRAVKKSVVVAAAPARVWEALTTTAGAQSFFAPAARIEARVGGAYEIYFMSDAPAGSRGSDGCTILALDAPRSLTFSWNFPPSMPTLRSAHTLVTIVLTPADEGRTKVDLEQTGWRNGPDWTKGFEYFDGAWGKVLGNLQKRFQPATR